MFSRTTRLHCAFGILDDPKKSQNGYSSKKTKSVNNAKFFYTKAAGAVS